MSSFKGLLGGSGPVYRHNLFRTACVSHIQSCTTFHAFMYSGSWQWLLMAEVVVGVEVVVAVVL